MGIQRPQGLSAKQVTELSKQGFTNAFRSKQSKSLLLILFSNIVDLPNIIIFISIVFLVVYGQGRDAMLISVVVFTNILVSIFQEIKARNALKKITFLRKETVTVVREGREQQIDPETIVTGDVIRLDSGKYLYVDGELLIEEGLLVDESILSGESEYVKRNAGEQLLSGSFIVAGKGYYRADKIGADSFVNRITQKARNYIAYLSPLQRQVNDILKTMTYITIGTISVLLTINILNGDTSRVEIVNAVVSVINSMVPQGIVLSLTIAFLIGALRMAREKIIVQKSSTIETLSAVKILCMDKTGTITENKLELNNVRYYAAQKSASKLISAYCDLTLEQNKTIMSIAARFPREVKGNVMEQLPFTSKAKMSGLDLIISGKRYQMLLGSVASLSRYLSRQELNSITAEETKFAAKGYRNLLMLFREVNIGSHESLTADGNTYKPLALFSLEDKLRKNAKQIIEQFLEQGIKPVIISGDHPETLKALINQLGITGLNTIVTGEELDKIKDKHEFTEKVIGSDIFARVSPEQKVRIIKSYQKIYKYVAMIGDGVNDALAIKQANLGVAMGSGADVTKNIADVILVDDNIGKLANVMIEGKIILINTLRSAQLLIVKNIYSFIIVIVSLFAGLEFPFFPIGLFFLAFLNGTLPVLAILADRPAAESPLDFTYTLTKFVITGGIASGVLGILIFALNRDMPLEQSRGMLIGFLIICGIFNYLFSVNGSFNFLKILNKPRHLLIVVITIIMYAGAMYIEFFSQLLRIYRFNTDNWITVIVFGFAYMLLFTFISTIVEKILQSHQNRKLLYLPEEKI